MTLSTTKRIRDVRIAPLDSIIDRRADGTIYMRSPQPLGPYPEKITERLEHWAAHAPQRTFMAQRDAEGRWRHLSYAEALGRVRSLSQALVDRRLSSDRPLLILSGNSIEHALLAHAAMYSGVMYSPVAPAYSLLAKQHHGLRYIVDLMKPGMVFAAEGAAYEPALRNVLPQGAELVVSSLPESMPATPLAALEATPVTSLVDTAHARVTGDTIAKILFTSGSTGRPKAVINTQRMLCSNQEMLRTVMQFMADEPPVLCDWLPWNHTFGGNHNVGLVLYNGGTFYLDEGKPTPEGIKTTVRNLREIATTAYFNVPRGYEVLMPYLKADAVLRERFFSRVKLLFYAAAGLGQRFWDEVRDLAIEACGEEILMMTGLGATESAPYAISTGKEGAASGMIGLPVPGVELKLVTTDTKTEARLRGPSITPGFWRQDELTRSVFDEEGYYNLGDAVRFADPDDPKKGLMFDGRINEDFKLSTGTWVSVGPLRSRFLGHFGAYVQDVVIAGPDRAFVAALVFPHLDACEQLCLDAGPPKGGPHVSPSAGPVLPHVSPSVGPVLSASAEATADRRSSKSEGWSDRPGASERTRPTPREMLDHPAVRERFQALLADFARQQTGGSRAVARVILMDERPSFDAREITDKGSLNQRAVLTNRAALVDELYADTVSSRVITFDVPARGV